MSNLFNEIKELKPQFVVIDSIQTLKSDNIDSAAGTISQIRYTTSELINYAKQTNIPVILVRHITKDGQIAGPKILEHMVDTVLNFEGEVLIFRLQARHPKELRIHELFPLP